MNIQKDSETVAQACFNIQDITRGLLRMVKEDILEQLSKEALLVLEKKAFATEHRGQYLLEKQKRPKFDSPDEKRKGKLDKSLVDKFNLSGNINKTVSRVTMKEENEFFSEYLMKQLKTIEYQK